VEAVGLTKVFQARGGNAVRAVDGVSFGARYGEIFGLLGINGAGKTTTLRTLATMLKPTAGRASVAGHSVTREPEAVRRAIGFMSSATSLYGRLTAAEMVTYFGRLNGMTENAIRKRMDDLFELFDMRDFADRRCDKLSSGMKQKVSIVRTVLHDPDVMIFDEPTAGLDVLTSRTIVEFVRDCRRRFKCVIFSTHIMEEVEKICDRVGVIHDGRLLAVEPTAALRARVPSGRVEDAFVALVEASAQRPRREAQATAPTEDDAKEGGDGDAGNPMEDDAKEGGDGDPKGSLGDRAGGGK
jgi:sodium transport system ATP-binding protein